jgi:hypothetical protein
VDDTLRQHRNRWRCVLREDSLLCCHDLSQIRGGLLVAMEASIIGRKN